MKILNLSLKYFRQHTDTAIELADGLTAIIGSNGAGKTTLVEAIAFALYGSRVIRGKVEDVKTRGAPKGAKTEVNLLFEQEGRNYRIERSLSEARLFIGGEATPAVNGTREVNSSVQTLLGMDYGEFLSAFFTEQKGLEFLSGTRGGAERERFIIRMMGYDRLERAQEMLRADKRDCRNEIGGREAALGSREEMERRLKAEEMELKRLGAICEEAAAALKGAEARAKSTRKALQGLEQKKISYEKASALHRESQVRLEERSLRLKKLQSDIALLLKQAEDTGLEDYQHRLDAAQIKAAKLEERLLETREKLNQIQAAYRDKLVRARSAREELEKRLHQALSRQKKYETLDPQSPCPTCGQNLGESFSKVQSDFAVLIGDLRSEIERCLQEEKATALEPAEFGELRNSLDQIEKEQQAAREEIQRLDATRQVLERKERLEAEIAMLSSEVERFSKDTAALRASLESLGFSPQEYAGEKGASEAAEKLEQVARLQKVRQDADHEKQLALIARTRQAIDEYDGRQAELNLVRQKLLVLEQGDIALTQFRKYLNAGIRPRLSELAGEFLADLTDGRYAAVEIGADFSPTVIDENGPRAVISGGEQDILNLCMRLALSHMLVERSGQVISLLILDEVFGSLDENRRNNVLSLLEKLGNRFEQILVITHFDDLKDAVQNIVYVDFDDTAGTLRVGDGIGGQIA